MCVHVRVRARVRAYVYVSFHRTGISWLKKTNVMPEIRPAMLRWGNVFLSKTFFAMS